MTLLTENAVQANRWIRFDVVTRSFEITDYVMNELNVQANPVTVSADFDIIMMDTHTADKTPRRPGMTFSYSRDG